MALDLSKKRHYTFPQLASKLECSLDDLRYYVIEGELYPSHFLPAGKFRQYLMLPGDGYDTTGYVYPNELTSQSELEFDVVQTTFLQGFHYLVLKQQTSAFHCEYRFAASKPSGFDIGDLVFELEAVIGIDEVMQTGVVMAVEVDRFEALNSRPGKPPGLEKSLTTTEINSLLELVIGMAIKGYCFNPVAKKNTATKDIANDLAALGIKIDDGTVLKYLKLAAATVLPTKPPQP